MVCEGHTELGFCHSRNIPILKYFGSFLSIKCFCSPPKTFRGHISINSLENPKSRLLFHSLRLWETKGAERMLVWRYNLKFINTPYNVALEVITMCTMLSKSRISPALLRVLFKRAASKRFMLVTITLCKFTKTLSSNVLFSLAAPTNRYTIISLEMRYVM